MIDGIAQVHGVSADMTFTTEIIETRLATVLTDAVARVEQGTGLDVIPERNPTRFSEDFAQCSAVVRDSLPLLADWESGSCRQPLHSSDHDFNDALSPVASDFRMRLVKDRLPLREGTSI